MSEVEPAIDDELSDADPYARHAAELVRFATVLAGASGADDLVAETVARCSPTPTGRTSPSGAPTCTGRC